jgi:sterol desaturase/sphingolipid hydroxylase (fatty acid hydroxylase superfamily)
MTLQKHWPIAALCGAFVLQCIYYYPKLAEKVAYQYESSDLSPRKWCSKRSYFGLILVPFAAVVLIGVLAGAAIIWPLLAVLALFLVINQYIIGANLHGGKLHWSIWVMMGGIAVAVLVLAFTQKAK